MRINFRQGIVSHEPPIKSDAGYGPFLPGFMQKNGNNYNLIANDKPVTLTIAHKNTNYTFVEDSSVTNAWIGPFTEDNTFWLYWDFNPLTFERSFGKTTIEPIAQSVEPGKSDAAIIQTISGEQDIGRFIVEGYYAPRYGRDIIISGTESNDGTYKITSSSFDNTTGNTSLFVSTQIAEDQDSGGVAAFDVDSYGLPLKTVDRHWYDTSANVHKVWKGNYWAEVLRVFAVQISFGGSAVYPHTISHGTTIGTQIGDTSSVRSGRVMYDEDTNTIRRDNGTFFTTEDQFLSGSSRVDAIRLESNVARAQFPVNNATAAFTPVTWYEDGRCRVATYNDIGSSVIGMLTEDVSKDEVGSIVIQGVITNPEWNWSATNPNYPYVKVGYPLWIDNGELVPYDPHTTNVVQYPVGRVPVARVLGSDTVIFEQGLGGKGDRGPVGSLEDMPPASYDYIGGVFLSIDPEVPEDPVAVGDNDPRMDPSFKHDPTPHTHNAMSVTFAPSGTLQSDRVQTVIEELDASKLNKSGGTMTGSLTLSSDPAQPLQAASKQYVDGLVSGLLWMDPICVMNLIAIDVSSPPSQPEFSDAYIVPAFPTGAWAIGNAMNIQTGDLVVWNGSEWMNRGPLESTKTYRFGVSLTSATPPVGVLSSHKNKIITALGSNISNFDVESPVNNSAVFVCNESSMYAYQQFAFKDTPEESKWINVGGTGGTAIVVVDDLTIRSQGNVIGTIDYADGGSVDARSLQGQTLTDLDGRYASLSHNHTGTSIGIAPYTTSPNWGNPSDITSVQINSTTVESALRELNDDKASKTPSYQSKSSFPAALNVEGMIAYSLADKNVYIAVNGIWEELSTLNNKVLTIPYDIGFQIQGPIYTDYTQGAFVVTRDVTIPALAPGSIARALTAFQNSVTFDVFHNTTAVGTISFPANVTTGLISIPQELSLSAGDVLKIGYSGGTTIAENDITAITFVGAASTTTG